MSIEALLKVLPAPLHPEQTFAGPWDAIEASLRTAIPDDYKEFVRIYGYGYFMEFFGINVPRSKNPYTCFEEDVLEVANELRPMFREFEEPYRLWPEPEGLIFFGGTDNGDSIFWLPVGPPQTWKVVVWDRHDFEVFDCDMTTFLAGLITGEIMPEAFPDNLLPCELLFQPKPPPTDFD